MYRCDENSKRFKIVGLIGLQHEIKNKVGNYEVIGVDSDLKILSKTIKYALITIGQIKTFKKMDLFIKAKIMAMSYLQLFLLLPMWLVMF